ncbi:hypothetical protein [Colwellia psychrerythraea]|uniref:Uncharacterized protein n=1 Tax=Colwellia psychrerythraea TaxID=28229 RepID=A0A099KJ96_COLPS|nr:hypothetical protein [Colwellia psychrerythraea]KGJ89623.1 hypothetical protein ND2E_3814 [Colwellia psychrerythraea]
MAEHSNIVYNEIDFLIPSYRFNIRYSYISKRGLSFIREFVLRLAHLSPMKPIEISGFLGLTEREAKEAIRDLIEREELTYNEQGQVALTAKACGYFPKLGESPQVSDVVTTGTVLGFEVTDFNCVSTHSRRLNDKWSCGIRIDAKSELIANRAKLAEKAFQKQFHALLDKEYITNVRESEGTGRPNIYKIDSLKQIGTEPFRVKFKFLMDNQGEAVEADEIEQLDTDELALVAIEQALDNTRVSNNLREIILAIESMGDTHTGSFINEQGLNVDKFTQLEQSRSNDNGDFIPFVGSLYSRNNWEKFSKQFELAKHRVTSKHQDGVKSLTWLAPSEGLWGRNNALLSCFDSLISGAKTKGKKQKTLYKPTLFVPLSSKRDGRASRRWKDELPNHLSHVNGYIEGFLGGAVEVVLLQDELVSVTYYVSLPDKYPVPIPVGFISKSKVLVDRVAEEINQYLMIKSSHEDSRDLGVISKL